ncbi:MAG: hypothetical protein KCHDKBKB_00297 [Elusimicrobia bacterium]|nr:hypothetical protein [Elusimicrobiota bacterium]
MKKFICIHGHFYQPPRENPWIESIEQQDSAYPYHDWNERILAECYGPNGTSRILDENGRITKIVNNYSRINFNFGPTLLSWMEENAHDTYRSVLEADQESRERFSGHGSAIAQVYNHMILPLANSRDKFTQIHWGIRDFEFRFGRKPEGLWLSETAVDLESLEIMARLDIKYTILAPSQAKAFRRRGDPDWIPLHNGSIDPTRPYWLKLPSGKELALFFYDGPISRAVAFERLLDKGDYLINRLMGGFTDQRSWDQLVHIATDGETYGHHHRHGEMALAYALEQIEAKGLAKLTNYGEFLALNPPVYEVQIHENTSWSCMHGIERWRSDCGCNAGGMPEWNQSWRKPLREALDWLRNEIIPLFEKKGADYYKDPWGARDEYIELLFDRSHESIEEFLKKWGSRELAPSEKSTALKLLELQRQAMLMYTSCGWFFNDISGIETIQILQYAGRVLQLSEELFDQSFEAAFLERLAAAKSNVVDMRDGRRVYEKYVKSSSMDLLKVGAHYAISSLFSDGVSESNTYCYRIEYEDYKTFTAGKARLVVGWIHVISDITLESERLVFSILHLGDHNLSGGVCRFTTPETYGAMIDEMVTVFRKADFSETIRVMDRHFGSATYSLKSLFRDEQRKIVASILGSVMAESEMILRQIYENNVPLMRFLADLSAPLPKALQAAAEFSVNLSLRHALEGEEMDVDKVRGILEEAKEARIPLDGVGLAYVVQNTLGHMVDALWAEPQDQALMNHFNTVMGLITDLPFEVSLWNVQNNYYEFFQRIYPNVKARAEVGDETAIEWKESFLSLGEKLRVKIDG